MRPAIPANSRWLVAAWIALGLAVAAWAQAPTPPAAPAAVACPPVAQPPTPEQLRDGLAAARDRGLLWRLTKDGRRSYLYGTVHVGKLEWAFPGPELRAALSAADTVAVEIDLTDPAMRQQLAAQLGAPARSPELANALRERIARQAAVACLPERALERQHPLLQVMTLTVLAARWDGFDPAYAQELVLGGFARAAAKPVVSLESARQQSQALIPADPADALRIAELSLEQLERGHARRLLARLARAWERGDLDALENQEQLCDCVLSDDERRFVRRLNDERNPHLAQRIDELHAGGSAIFAAVGALHMTGEQSLPRLLRQRGYTVERIAFAPM